MCRGLMVLLFHLGLLINGCFALASEPSSAHHACAFSLTANFNGSDELARTLNLIHALVESGGLDEEGIMHIVAFLREEEGVSLAIPGASLRTQLGFRAVENMVRRMARSDKELLSSELQIAVAKARTTDLDRSQLIARTVPSHTVIKFIYIEPGEVVAPYLVGIKYRGAYPGEEAVPVIRKVDVQVTRGFWVADIPVTKDIWSQVMGAHPPAELEGDLPMANLSKFDVDQFLERLNNKMRRSGLESLQFLTQSFPPGRFDLPSMAQYALVAKTILAIPNNQPDLTNSWVAENSDRRLHPVRELAPLKLPGGLIYDVEGNVKEMLRDGEGRPGTGAIDPVVDSDENWTNHVLVGASYEDSFASDSEWKIKVDEYNRRFEHITHGFRLVYIPDGPAAPSRLARLKSWLKEAIGRIAPGESRK